MHTLLLKLDHLNTSYRLLKGYAKMGYFQKKNARPLVLSISKDFDPSKNSNLNTSLERSSQELLNAYFIFEIGPSKHKL